MATYKGLFEVDGALGEVFFYTLNGKRVVRRRSGFNAKDYRHNPNYEGIRRNTSEFGHCSQVGKALRTALHPYLKNRSDLFSYQRVAKVMTQIKNLDQSAHGERTVFGGWEDARSRVLLKSIQWKLHQQAPVGIHWNRSANGLKLNITPGFDFALEVKVVEIRLREDLEFERQEHLSQTYTEPENVVVNAHFDEGMVIYGICVGDYLAVV